jgi:hypothetical protein
LSNFLIAVADKCAFTGAGAPGPALWRHVTPSRIWAAGGRST